MEMICEPCQNGDHNSHQISLGWICVGCACNWQSTLPAESPADLVSSDPAEQARLSYSAAMDAFNSTDDMSMESMLEVVMYASLSIAESLLAQQAETPQGDVPLEQHIREALELIEGADADLIGLHEDGSQCRGADHAKGERIRVVDSRSYSEIYAGATPLEPYWAEQPPINEYPTLIERGMQGVREMEEREQLNQQTERAQQLLSDRPGLNNG